MKKKQIDLAIGFLKSVKYCDPIVSIGFNLSSSGYIMLGIEDFERLFPVSKIVDHDNEYVKHTVEVEGVEIMALSPIDGQEE